MRRPISVVIIALATLATQGASADEPPADAPPAASTTAPPPAAPEPPGQTKEEVLATELFTAARELMASGKYVEACPRLVESARLSKKVGTYGKLAECDEKLGRLVAARADFQQAQNLARALGDERLPIVEQELARLDALVPRLLLSISGSAPLGLKIAVDGVDIGAGSLETPIPLDPGRHAVLVTAPDKQPWTASLELAADGKTTRLSVPALPGVQRAAPEPPKPAVRSPLAIGGILATGLGAGALGVGAYFGGLAQARTDESNRTGCAGNSCTERGARIRNDARAAGDVATALFVAGGAVVAGGLTLWLVATEPRAAQPQPPRARSGGITPAGTPPPQVRVPPSAEPRVSLRVSFDTVSIEGSF